MLRNAGLVLPTSVRTFYSDPEHTWYFQSSQSPLSYRSHLRDRHVDSLKFARSTLLLRNMQRNATIVTLYRDITVGAIYYLSGGYTNTMQNIRAVHIMGGYSRTN